jgi:hypothetical protein
MLPRVVKGDKKGQWRRCLGSALYGGTKILAAPKNDTGHSSWLTTSKHAQGNPKTEPVTTWYRSLSEGSLPVAGHLTREPQTLPSQTTMWLGQHTFITNGQELDATNLCRWPCETSLKNLGCRRCWNDLLLPDKDATRGEDRLRDW